MVCQDTSAYVVAVYTFLEFGQYILCFCIVQTPKVKPFKRLSLKALPDYSVADSLYLDLVGLLAFFR